VPLNLHYKGGRIKLDIALARGKLKHDKRADEREKEWNREKQRVTAVTLGFFPPAPARSTRPYPG
jgi:SsrA-binding protein